MFLKVELNLLNHKNALGIPNFFPKKLYSRSAKNVLCTVSFGDPYGRLLGDFFCIRETPRQSGRFGIDVKQTIVWNVREIKAKLEKKTQNRAFSTLFNVPYLP